MWPVPAGRRWPCQGGALGWQPMGCSEGLELPEPLESPETPPETPPAPNSSGAEPAPALGSFCCPKDTPSSQRDPKSLCLADPWWGDAHGHLGSCPSASQTTAAPNTSCEASCSTSGTRERERTQKPVQSLSLVPPGVCERRGELDTARISSLFLVTTQFPPGRQSRLLGSQGPLLAREMRCQHLIQSLASAVVTFPITSCVVSPPQPHSLHGQCRPGGSL